MKSQTHTDARSLIREIIRYLAVVDAFRAAGGENFAAIPCLNDSAGGMAVIRDIVMRELKGWV